MAVIRIKANTGSTAVGLDSEPWQMKKQVKGDASSCDQRTNDVAALQAVTGSTQASRVSSFPGDDKPIPD